MTRESFQMFAGGDRSHGTREKLHLMSQLAPESFRRGRRLQEIGVRNTESIETRFPNTIPIGKRVRWIRVTNRSGKDEYRLASVRRNARLHME